MIRQLERAAGFERDDDEESKLDKLEAMLAMPGIDVPAVAPLFARPTGRENHTFEKAPRMRPPPAGHSDHIQIIYH